LCSIEGFSETDFDGRGWMLPYIYTRMAGQHDASISIARNFAVQVRDHSKLTGIAIVTVLVGIITQTRWQDRYIRIRFPEHGVHSN
jgi:hypothetical protein